MAARGADGRFIAGIELGLKDQISGPMARLAAKFAPWGRQAAKAFDPVKAASKAAQAAFSKAADLKQAADGIKGFSTGMIAGVSKPIKKMMEFEEIMSSVRANTFNGVMTAETKKEFEELSATARKLGADTKYSGVEAAEGMVLLATAGFDAQQQIAAMPGVLNLAAASNESIADSAEIASSAMAQFGLKAADMGRIGDVIAKTAQSSQTGLLDLGEAMKYAGVSAKNAGVSIEETTAMLGALGDAGVKGSAAGTTLRSVLSSLQAPSKKGKSALQFLGIDTKDKKGNMRPIEEILSEMDAAMDKRFGKDKNGNRRANLLKGLFDEANAANASLLIAKAGSGELEKKIGENMGAAGTAAKVAADMSNNTAGSAKELESAMEELQLSIGELLIPTVREFVELAKEVTTAVTGWAKEHPDLVKWLGLGAVALGVMGTAIWGVTTAAGICATTWGVVQTAWGLAAGAGTFLVKGLNILKAAALSNPITALLVGVSTAALLVYEYWGPIKGFFTGLWDSIGGVFKSTLDWIFGKIEWAAEKIRLMKDYLTGQESYTAEGVAAGQGKLRAASDEELQQLAQAGGAVGDQARQTLMERRKAQAQAPAVLEAASRAASGIGAGFRDPIASAFTSPATPVAMPSGLPIGMPSGVPIQGLDSAALSSVASKPQKFDGDLKITIDAEGQVKGTKLKTAGTPAFAVRVNTGVQ